MGRDGRVIDLDPWPGLYIPGFAVELFPEGQRSLQKLGSEMFGNARGGNFKSDTNPKDRTERGEQHGQLGQGAAGVALRMQRETSSTYQRGRADLGKKTEVRTNWYDVIKLGRGPNDVVLRFYEKDRKKPKIDRAYVLVFPLNASGLLWYVRGWYCPNDLVAGDQARNFGDLCWEVSARRLSNFPVPEMRERRSRSG